MKNIDIIKYNHKKIIEKKTISNVGAMFDENKEVIDRLYSLLSMFLHPNDAGNFKLIMQELQEQDYIKIEMYKE